MSADQDQKTDSFSPEVQAIFEASVNPLLLLDESDRVLIANYSTSRSLGLDTDELLGQHVSAIVPVEHNSNEQRRLASALSDLGHRITLKLRNKEGGVSRYQLCATHLFINSRSLKLLEIYTVEHVYDMVDQLESEVEQLKTVNDRLQQSLAEQTANLSKQDIFLSNASHELRTPLAAVQALVDALLDEEDDNKRVELLETVRTTARTGLSAVDHLIMAGRVSKSGIALSPEYARVDQVIDYVKATDAKLAEREGVDFIVECADELAEIEVKLDLPRLIQAVSALTNNGVKFTQKGSVKLRISVLERHERMISLRFEVVDTGIGIAESNREIIFTPFEQVDARLSRDYVGLGLGLSLARKLLKLMRSEIRVDSKLGRGSRFWFDLNCRYRFSGKQVRHNGVHLLIVNLSHTITEQIESVALERRYYVEHVGSSAAAATRIVLAALHNYRFACMMLDCTGDVDEGMNLLERLSSIARRGRQIRVGSVGIHSSQEEFETILNFAHSLNAESDLPELFWIEKFGGARTTAELFDRFLSNESIGQFKAPELAISQIEELLDLETFPLDLSSVEVRAIIRSAIQRHKQAVTVLLVEDSPVNMLAAQARLVKYGINVIAAENGLLGVKAARDRSIDLVLMDLQMPVMDGFEACKQIRALPGHELTEIHALTASSFESDGYMAQQVGMKSLIVKPLDDYKLMCILVPCLARLQKQKDADE